MRFNREIINIDYNILEHKNNNKKINILLFCVIFITTVHIFFICMCIYVYILERANINTLYGFISSVNNDNLETIIKNIIFDISAILETVGSVDNIDSFVVKVNIIIDTICDIIYCSNTTALK